MPLSAMGSPSSRPVVVADHFTGPGRLVRAVGSTTLLLATGEALEVRGELEQVSKELENAARSSAGTLAWLEDAADGERFGVNPSHVVWVRRGRD
jgi:hypothetical protein